MAVAVNYWWAALIVVLSILLIIWFIKRNNKDEKTFEKEMIQSETPPEKHDENKEVNP